MGIRHHDEPQISERLVVVKLVVFRPVRDEAVVVAAELADYVAQGEYGPENELRIVAG